MDHPISTCTLPSNNKKVQFRPFLEKERKLLLMIAEGEAKIKEIMTVIKQIASNCLIDKIDVENMAVIDLEYLFLQLRMKSMGEVVQKQFMCTNELSIGINCNATMKLDIDLSKVDVVNLDVKREIKLSPTVVVKMKYPTIGVDEDAIDYEIIISCIEYVADKDQIYYTKNYTKEEMNDFITHLNMAQFEALEQFYLHAPMLTTTIHHKCVKCGYNHEIIFEGLQSLFT